MLGNRDAAGGRHDRHRRADVERPAFAAAGATRIEKHRVMMGDPRHVATHRAGRTHQLADRLAFVTKRQQQSFDRILAHLTLKHAVDQFAGLISRKVDSAGRLIDRRLKRRRWVWIGGGGTIFTHWDKEEGWGTGGGINGGVLSREARGRTRAGVVLNLSHDSQDYHRL